VQSGNENNEDEADAWCWSSQQNKPLVSCITNYRGVTVTNFLLYFYLAPHPNDLLKTGAMLWFWKISIAGHWCNMYHEVTVMWQYALEDSCAWLGNINLLTQSQRLTCLIFCSCSKLGWASRKFSKRGTFRDCSAQFLYQATSLSLFFGVAHAPFACQRWGLPHRLAQCVTPGRD